MNLKCKAMLVAGGALLLVGLLLWLAYLWTTRTFYNVNILTIFLYITSPLTGVEKRYLIDAGFFVLALLLVFVFVMFRVRKFVARTGMLGACLFTAVSAAVFASSLFAIEKQFQVVAFLFPAEPYSTYIDDNYSMFAPGELVFENGSNNLILVILESTESSFTDGRVFSPPIMPACAALEKEAIVFRGHQQCLGTDASIPGFISMMLGVPTMPVPTMREVITNLGKGGNGAAPSASDVVEIEKKALPNIFDRDWRDYSVLGLLEQKGYGVSFFLGADIRFGGFYDFIIAMTRNCEIRDLHSFRETRAGAAEALNGWGLYDSFLFARAKEYLTGYSRDKPFCMVIQTVNTHLPGFFEPGMQRPFGDIRDAFLQVDGMLPDFLEWIREQPFAENTTVAFIGDHVYPDAAIGPVTPPAPRGIMCMLFNPRGRPEPESVNRTFATFDVAPTLLEAVGASFPRRRFGLGVSLFSTQQTLLEKDGLSKFNRNIISRSKAHEERYGW